MSRVCVFRWSLCDCFGAWRVEFRDVGVCVHWCVVRSQYETEREALEMCSTRAVLAMTQQSLGQRGRPPAVRKVIKSMGTLHS